MRRLLASSRRGQRSPLSTTRRRRLAARLAVGLAVGSVTSLVHAQGVDAEKAAAVKAGFVVNFIRYTTWPVASFEGPESPYRVVVIGSDLVAQQLEEIARRTGPISESRKMTVARLPLVRATDAEDDDPLVVSLRQAHLLFVGEEDGDKVADLLARVEGHEVLTVGDGPAFAALGGMIGLWRDGERIVFDANPGAIRATGLSVSARVLKLAHIVETGGAP